ncbi:MAG: alkaline-shock protein [Roseburia sp. 40_7]|nr:MAG: alkaline-shock protein [Roseburia sp. 40_7]
MAEDRQSFSIKEDKSGTVHVAGEVVAIITNELVSKLGMKNLSKGVKVEVTDDSVEVNLSLNIAYGYSIPEVSNRVQERVKAAIENMTGLQVLEVNIRIASVDMENSK